MNSNRDIKKAICGLIYIAIIIIFSKYMDMAFKGTRVTIISKVSDNILNIRISNISKLYKEELETKKSTKESKELYVEKVYKKLIEEPVYTPSYNYYNNANNYTNTVANNTVKRINASQIVLPNIGTTFAKISIPSCSIYTNIVLGFTQDLVDNYDIAMQEAISSIYKDPMLPGFARPMLLAGHNYKSLGRLKNIVIGSVITVQTNYGTFYYTVTEAKKAKLNVHGTTILDVNTGKDLITYYGNEQLQIYTCDSADPNDGTRFFVRAIRSGGTEVVF